MMATRVRSREVLARDLVFRLEVGLGGGPAIESKDKKVLGSHPLRSEGEREGHCEWETYRSCYDNECHRDGRYLGEGDALLARSTMKTYSEWVARR